MFTCVYRERRTYTKYDNTHIIGYLNETIVKDYKPESEEEKETKPFDGYQYIGTETDGGTILFCTKPGDRDDMINAIIRSRYTVSEEMAIHRHSVGADASLYIKEWEEYDKFCENAKFIVDDWLAYNK